MSKFIYGVIFLLILFVGSDLTAQDKVILSDVQPNPHFTNLSDSEKIPQLDRKVIDSDINELLSTELKAGKVTFKICIDRKGEVRSAVVVESLSTFEDPKILRKFINAAMSYRYEADVEAPEYECGALVFVMEEN